MDIGEPGGLQYNGGCKDGRDLVTKQEEQSNINQNKHNTGKGTSRQSSGTENQKEPHIKRMYNL